MENVNHSPINAFNTTVIDIKSVTNSDTFQRTHWKVWVIFASHIPKFKIERRGEKMTWPTISHWGAILCSTGDYSAVTFCKALFVGTGYSPCPPFGPMHFSPLNDTDSLRLYMLSKYYYLQLNRPMEWLSDPIGLQCWWYASTADTGGHKSPAKHFTAVSMGILLVLKQAPFVTGPRR